MIRRLFPLLSLLVVSGLVAFGQPVDQIRKSFLDADSPKILVASHRATHNRFPENSLQAIRESIALGVDIIEIDVKVSSDGIPFLMHDRTMDRTTTGKGDPEMYSWKELQQLFVVDRGKRTSLKIPTLEDALTLAKGNILVDLDLKTDRIAQIIAVVEKTDTRDIVFFFDSDYNVLSRVKDTGKDLMIMPRTYNVLEVDSAIALFDPPVVHIDFSFYTPTCIERIKDSHARVWINSLGDCDDDIRNGKTHLALEKLLARGANIVQTDEPELLLKALRENGYRMEKGDVAKEGQ